MRTEPHPALIQKSPELGFGLVGGREVRQGPFRVQVQAERGPLVVELAGEVLAARVMVAGEAAGAGFGVPGWCVGGEVVEDCQGVDGWEGLVAGCVFEVWEGEDALEA